MIVLHCTKRMLDRLKVKPESEPPESTGLLGSWYVDLKYLDRQQYALLFNPTTYLTVIVYAKDFRRDHAVAAATLKLVLDAIGVPEDVCKKELDAFGSFTYTKTASRAVLGSMTRAWHDVLFQIYNGRDLDDVSIRMSKSFWSRTIEGTTKQEYFYPYEAIAKVLNVATHEPKVRGQITLSPTLAFAEGFFAALASMPDLVMPTVWLPQLLNNVFALHPRMTQEQLHGMIDMLITLYNAIAESCLNRDPTWAVAFTRPDGGTSDEFASGYMYAMELYNKDHWREFLRAHPQFEVIFEMAYDGDEQFNYDVIETGEIIRGMVYEIHKLMRT